MKTPSSTGKMRGVEAALYIWERALKGGTVSETLRAVAPRVSPEDRTLAASLCYALARRLSLWQHLRALYMMPKPSKFSRAAQLAVLVGTAGLTELRNFAPAVLISSLVDWTKVRDRRGAGVVNAVLRKVLERAPDEIARLEADGGLEAQCLLCGVPLWIGRRWVEQYGVDGGRRMIAMNAGSPSLSLRLAPRAPADFADRLSAQGVGSFPSPMPGALRIDGTALPSSLPGYNEGWFTPQSESSMMVGKIAADFDGNFLLDMCAGRGVKTGQIAALRPDAVLEGWDLSQGRIAAAQREMERLGLSERVTLKPGNSLELTPARAPEAILVDAPCSGSGTWRRHPEGKWRLGREALAELSQLQSNLLARAFSLVREGGKVVYSTCSLLAEENENVVGRALALSSGVRAVEVPLAGAVRRSFGAVILPENPWTDGFYVAAFTK
ncbi:MAG: RsmB/NOP family class I SAM-dependent RNA methyltransferase [Pyramidobacter sp.]